MSWIRRLYGLARSKTVIVSMAVAATIVAANGFFASYVLPSSYGDFTWEAYAAGVYPSPTATATSSATPTATSTQTPTASATPEGGIPTPTRTPTDFENSSGQAACNDGFDNDFDGRTDCFDSDCVGSAECVSVTAPAASGTTLVIAVVLLLLMVFFGLVPIRTGEKQ